MGVVNELSVVIGVGVVNDVGVVNKVSRVSQSECGPLYVEGLFSGMSVVNKECVCP